MLLNDSARLSDTGHDEWSRVGQYLDRLAFENDRLEAELKLKKQRRLEREAEFERSAASPAAAFDEIAASSAYEARTATDATQGMHLSYDALRRDLSGLMSDLNDFKSTRAGLEARLGA